MLPIQHFVARTHESITPLQKRDACAATWRLLRRAYPDALAALLMPNHIHLLVQISDSMDESGRPAQERAADSWQQTLGRISLAIGLPRGSWASPPPEWTYDSTKLWRQIRYVHLNPCRDGLCRDPLEWEWSTYRDYLGVAFNPWTNWDLLARYIDRRMWRKEGTERLNEFHRLTSSDPSCASEGTASPFLPRLPIPTDAMFAALYAVQAITRGDSRVYRRKGSIQRKAAVLLLERQGKLFAPDLAHHWKLSRHAIYLMRDQKSSLAIEIAKIGERFLSDRRLVLPRNPIL